MHAMDIRIYYEDVDFGGVVYYANYLRFFERGRTEALRALGVDQTALKDAGLVFVVRRFETDYLRPARFDDLIRIETRVLRVAGASVEMAQRALREGVELALARARIACMTFDGRPARLPADLRAALAALAG
ncbi:tol-pal system-associated acyl-CoA thioesterase [Oceanicella actignis]|uniref:Acyl-CoA thioester hydrolase n=1 Tax=Oceanicella actignis TaxID=1189325 RepID=A0A1M7TVV4_9RHOB|nr:tol-pal system-associated acyl-CoA thioesterase [Oceanicella actignis]SES80905.1 acyl-CoA thioester hydrolase [Oceanicella actignis]SHN74848.1 acyl-CoA thioester hydrolase [Oceanicella actignis]